MFSLFAVWLVVGMQGVEPCQGLYKNPVLTVTPHSHIPLSFDRGFFVAFRTYQAVS